MKKTYLAPAMVMTEIETEELICQSLRMGMGPAGDGTYGLANDRYYYDDDDEEEEDLW